MASLGNVANTIGGAKRMKVAPLSVYRGGSPETTVVGYNVAGRISGTVKISGVTAPGVVVRLYYRDNGNLIEQAISDASGDYSFAGLDTAALNAYYVVFIDPKTSSPYNYTVARDHITAG